jgi:hypothetical protein
MGFCTKCGRQRTGTEQFCGGCGAQFSDAAGATPPAAQPQAETAPAGQAAAQPAPETIVEPAPSAQTTVEPAAPARTSAESAGSAGESPNWTAAQAELPDIEPTRWDTNWYKPGPAPVSEPPAAPAETPSAAPSAAPPSPSGPPGAPSYGPPSYGQGGYGQSGQGGHGYGPASYAQGSPGQGPAGQGSYGQAPYQPPPHVPGTIGTPPLRRSQTAILTIALVVVLLAVGGGAYALVSRFTGHKTSAPPSGNPTLSAPATPAAGATTLAPRSATASPSQSATASPKVSPSAQVSVAAGVAASAAQPAVAAFLNKYFTAINAHDYAAYSSLLDAKEQSVNTPASFEAGYGTTTDSAEALTAIGGTSGGGEAATVSFTSHQSPADSPTKTSCTSWTITLYLQPNGGSYLIGPAPAGYHASYQAC